MNRNYEKYEWENKSYIIREPETKNAPFSDIPTKLPGIYLARDHPTTAVTDNKAENVDDNDGQQ